MTESETYMSESKRYWLYGRNYQVMTKSEYDKYMEDLLTEVFYLLLIIELFEEI